jgi:predicted GIY-YIG superfamily endonuclease
MAAISVTKPENRAAAKEMAAGCIAGICSRLNLQRRNGEAGAGMLSKKAGGQLAAKAGNGESQLALQAELAIKAWLSAWRLINEAYRRKRMKRQ